MCQVHKILKKYTVTFQIIKNTLKIALCYVPIFVYIYHFISVSTIKEHDE